MKVVKFLCIISAFIFLLRPIFSCAGARPDWVDSSSSISYPKEQYLTGVGSGDTRELAESNAYAAISKVFSSRITSVYRGTERYSQIMARDKKEISKEVNVEQLIEVATDKVLENITIAEVWYDSTEKKYYALAVIDRVKAGKALKERINSLDLEIREMVKNGRPAIDKIQKIRNLNGGIKRLMQREAYNEDLRIVDLSGKGMDSPIIFAEVKNELDKFLRDSFVIDIEMTGEMGSKVEAAIIEGLNRQGFSVGKKGQPADVILRANVEFKEPAIQNPRFKFIQWAAEFRMIKMINPNEDTVIGTVTQSGREGHLTIQGAREKAFQTLRKDVTEEVSKKLAGFIFGKD